MSINFSMGFQCGCSGDDEFDENGESEKVGLIINGDEDGMMKNGNGNGNGVMKVRNERVEFKPIEHPMEPQDEDRPVKCPLPTPSLINDVNHIEAIGERLEQKKREVETWEKQERIPVRAVRKRHHTLTRDTHIITMPPSLPTNNASIYQMLQQFHKFDS